MRAFLSLRMGGLIIAFVIATLLPMPAFAVRLAFGEMGDELLLTSARVQPTRLLTSGYVFRFPKLENALRHLLGKKMSG